MPPNPVTREAFDDYGLDDMTRQRHVYETAFDCRISKSDDDLDQIDKVSNHPVLMEVSNTWESKPLSEPSVDSNSLNRSNRNKEVFQKNGQEDNTLVLALSQDIKVGKCWFNTFFLLTYVFSSEHALDRNRREQQSIF